MADIVQECGDGRRESIGRRWLQIVIPDYSVIHLARKKCGSHAVTKAGVFGAMKGKVRKPILPNEAQPLKLWTGDQLIDRPA